MPHADPVAHGAHVMTVCNACRYCEQFCPVFPAMESRLTFAEADLAYLANLCHNCGECLYACQYAPPHEFGINVPRAMAEIRGSKDALERALDRPADVFAYPYGAYDDRVRALVSTQFALACSTRLAFAGPGSDVLGLERLDVHYLRRPRVFRRLWAPGMRAYLGARRALRELRAGARHPRRAGEVRA